jgi:ribosomal protein S1
MDLHEEATVEVMVSSVEDYGVLVELDNNKGVILVTNIYWDCYEAPGYQHLLGLL